MRLLLTGGAGFIGSHLAEQLALRGDEVAVLDNLDPGYDVAIKRRNLDRLRGRCHVVEGDVLDPELLDRLLGGRPLAAVIHLAALAGVRRSVQEPWRYQRVNVEGTARLAHAMAEHGVRRLVFASSSSVYGDGLPPPYRETDPAVVPASPYAASKRAAELVLHAMHRVRGLSVCVLRYFTVFGPRQRPGMAIREFCQAALRGEPITMFGDGESSRDYTYIDDAVAGTMAALDRAPEGLSTYNLGSGRPVRLGELIERIGRAVGTDLRVARAPMPAADVSHTLACIDAAARDLGYRPATSFDEGLRRFVAWLRQDGQSDCCPGTSRT
ncbi:MAG: NAD-dependent epimerase/dehydratase family protein [Deltaproteobacteria bacterium]|nr:NAD-dependent epimerase/dehydratase family protein [Deltaproteobacteria bacterium]